MSTPLWRHRYPVPPPLVQPSSPSLDDAFFGMLVDLASLPIRATDQADAGALRSDGLSVAVLRRLSLKWCATMRERGIYSRDELAGLELALRDFSDAEVRSMIEGAAAARRS